MTASQMWVFGYGSLLWNPGFDVAERAVARLDGYARRFCMRSIHHRGTEAEPGLVLALERDPDATCTGLALRVPPEQEDEVLAMLRERELISSAYHEVHVELEVEGGRRLSALAYVVDPDHAQYCTLAPEEQAEIIARARGGRGPNTEYLWNTAAHLRDLGIDDPDLGWLDDRVRRITGVTS